MDQQKKIKINNVMISYSEWGCGKPVLLVHGFGTNFYSWKYIKQQLMPNRRYIAIDLKGFGESDKPDDLHYSAFDQGKIVSGVVHALGLEGVTLVGHSLGGFICLIALLDDVDILVEKLILIDSVGYFGHVPPFIATLRIPIVNHIALQTLNPELLARTVLEKVYFDKSKIHHDLIIKYANVLHIPAARVSLMKSAEQFVSDKVKTVKDMFKNIAIPTLLIWGIDDLFIPITESYKFRRDLLNAQLKVIPECGHSPHEECPVETAAFINEFLA